MAQKKDAELFIEFLDQTFGKEDEIRRIKSTKPGLPEVHLFIYRNVPDERLITGVTYGIHKANHPSWKVSKPELVVSVESEDLSWLMAGAWLAESFRVEKPLKYGTVLTMDDPISDESEMRGFYIFAQSVVDPKAASVKLNDDTIHLSQMYPIYLDEVAVLEEMGLEGFWDHPRYDPYDVTRPSLAEEGDEVEDAD
jgi:hypothetical protein